MSPLTRLIATYIAAIGGVGALPNNDAAQQPLSPGPALPIVITNPAILHGSNVIEELVLAEIIPTVTDTFAPQLELNISWDGASAALGNTLKPHQLTHEPHINLHAVAVSRSAPRRRHIHPSTDVPLKPSANDNVVYEQFVVVLTDPDAKSRNDPKWAEFCHWIAYWPVSGAESSSSAKKQDIMPYKPPSAPPKTGLHRYVFLVLTPLNGTADELRLSAPSGRQRWGNDKVRTGVRQWAAQNGLGVVGANFIYSQNKKQ